MNPAWPPAEACIYTFPCSLEAWAINCDLQSDSAATLLKGCACASSTNLYTNAMDIVAFWNIGRAHVCQDTFHIMHTPKTSPSIQGHGPQVC